MTLDAASLDLDAVQRRTLRILTVAQVLGGLGVGAAISVGGLIAEDVSGSTSLSGLAQTATVLGAAVAHEEHADEGALPRGAHVEGGSLPEKGDLTGRSALETPRASETQ